jgi:zinc transporter 9
MAHGSTKAVYAAITANSIVMVAKFIGFALTGSGALLSEAIHSLADVSNQSLLALGIKQSEKAPDEDHPYGYGRAQYVWALISAVGIFFLGCGFTLYHGVEGVLHPPTELAGTGLAVGILLFSLVIESASGWVAVKAVLTGAKEADMPFRTYLRSGPDPMGVAVLLEDGAAVLGVLLALAALGMTAATGDPVWDGWGSISIALLLGLVAVFLIQKNKDFLMGSGMRTDDKAKVLSVLRENPLVESFHDTKGVVMDAEGTRFKVEVDFDGRVLADLWLHGKDLTEIRAGITDDASLHAFLQRYTEDAVTLLGTQIDEIEGQIKEAVPSIRHVDIEAD